MESAAGRYTCPLLLRLLCYGKRRRGPGTTECAAKKAAARGWLALGGSRGCLTLATTADTGNSPKLLQRTTYYVKLVGPADQRRERQMQASTTLVIGHPSIRRISSRWSRWSAAQNISASARCGNGFLPRGRQAPASGRKCAAMSPTGCRRRCGAKQFTWWRKAWSRSPMPMPQSPSAPAYAGR